MTAQSHTAGREITDAEAERFCALVDWAPDGSYWKTVEGEFRSVSFRDLAKGYIRAADEAKAVGAGTNYRLLTRSDTIQQGDEYLRDDCETWGEVKGWPIGGLYSPAVMVPTRRAIAKATGEAGT